MITFFEGKYTVKLKELEGKYAMKQTAHFSRVKSAGEKVQDSVLTANQNLYPQSIVGS